MTLSISRRFLIMVRKTLFYCVFILAIGLPFILLSHYQPDAIDFALDKIKNHSYIFQLFRWGIILSIVIFWQSLVDYLGYFFSVEPEKISFWKKEHWRIAMWLISFELLVCDNIVKTLIHLV